MRLTAIFTFCLLLAVAWSYPIEEEVVEEEPEVIELVPMPMRRIARRAPVRQYPQYRQGTPSKLLFYKPMPMNVNRDGMAVEPLMTSASSRVKDPLIASESGHGYGHGHGHGHGHHGYDYVDYGAYTGGYGAFGWYTDHPVYSSYGGGHGGY